MSVRIRLMLLTASAVALTLAMSPFRQFYLAWIALVPWIVAVAHARCSRAAFGWGSLGGTLFFAANLWPIALLTFSGAVLLTLVLAATWGFVAAVAHRCRLLDRQGGAIVLLARIAALACVWVTAESLRGRIIIEFPLFYLAHSQTPILPLCQIADIGGAAAVTFLVAGGNACVAMFMVRPRFHRTKLIAAASWLGLVAIAMIYGFARMHVDRTAGPRVMVVQSAVTFGRGGAVSLDQKAHFRSVFKTTQDALEARRASGQPNVDLVVWPESITPPLNDEAQGELRKYESGAWLHEADQTLSRLAAQYETSIIAGGFYVGDWKLIDRKRTGTDIRNAAYLYDKHGLQAARYDKIHLVPFGEYIPFRESVPRLSKLLEFLSPGPMNYAIQPGPPQQSLPMQTGAAPLRFAAAICFEDAMPELIRDMKDANFIVSLSNDGWFNRQFMAQRFDAALFRCIENRVPMARSENGGISGFIDSVGRRSGTISPWAIGASVEQLQLDLRRTVYQVTGDWFAASCSFVTLLLLIATLRRRAGAGISATPA